MPGTLPGFLPLLLGGSSPSIPPVVPPAVPLFVSQGAAATIPHMSFPVRYRNGRPVTVEQDSPGHMRDRIHVTSRTIIGDLLHDPTFGIPDQMMRVQRVDIDELAAALASSEPDIPVDVGRVDDGSSGLLLHGGLDDSIRIDIIDEG